MPFDAPKRIPTMCFDVSAPIAELVAVIVFVAFLARHRLQIPIPPVLDNPPVDFRVDDDIKSLVRPVEVLIIVANTKVAARHVVKGHISRRVDHLIAKAADGVEMISKYRVGHNRFSILVFSCPAKVGDAHKDDEKDAKKLHDS